MANVIKCECPMFSHFPFLLTVNQKERKGRKDSKILEPFVLYAFFAVRFFL